MAACSSYSKKKKNSVSSSKQPNYLYSSHRYDHFQHVILSGDTDLFEFELELEESDVFWGSNDDDEDRPCNVPSSKSIPRSAITSMIPPAAVTSNAFGMKKKPVSASLPVNVPDWSRVRQLREGDDDAGEVEGGGGGGDRTIMAENLPPHEYLARRRGESGMGRTLKGMELCRVRNEILKKLVGFED